MTVPASESAEYGGQIYLFSHIPKTGGAAVRAHFGQSLGSRFVYLGNTLLPIRHMSDAELLALSEEQKSEVSFVLGHNVKRETAGFFPGREVRFVTVLREPADMMLSQYNYRMWNAIQRLEGYPHPVVHDEKGKLVLPDFEAFWHEYGVKDMITSHILHLFGDDRAKNLSGNDAVDCAVELLQDFWLTLDCSSLREDSLPITRALGIPPVESIVNKSNSLYVMTDEIKAFCDDFWALDRKLYDRISAQRGRS